MLIAEQGIATLPDERWEQTRRMADVIRPLAQVDTVGHGAADEAAQSLGLSRRKVYVLIRRVRQGRRLVTDLASRQSSGGRGKGRLPESVGLIVSDLMQKHFLGKQKPKLGAVHRKNLKECKAQGLRAPVRSTVACWGLPGTFVNWTSRDISPRTASPAIRNVDQRSWEAMRNGHVQAA